MLRLSNYYIAIKEFKTMSGASFFGSPFLLGFDEIERSLSRIAKSANDGYPPYNVERTAASDGRGDFITITFAVAGFSPEELEVTVEKNHLYVRGQQKEDETRQYLHRGIAARQFQRSFVLAEGMDVTGAKLSNGLLSVHLARPEPKDSIQYITIDHDGS